MWTPVDLIFERHKAQFELSYLKLRAALGLTPRIVRWLPRNFR
jgi:hypothetical protein